MPRRDYSQTDKLNELSDEMAMKFSILYYGDTREMLLKAPVD